MQDVNRGYRDSHKGQGPSYHRSFSELPYRQLMWEMEKTVLDEVLSDVRTAKVSYLDFACGTGRILCYLESRVDSATGVEISESMLEVAKAASKHATLVQGDITQTTPFPERSFDLITAFRFFPNAEPDLREAVVRALSALLTNEGILVFNNHRNTSSLRNSVKRLLRLGTVSGLSHREIEQLVHRHGLVIDRVFHLGLWPGSEFRKTLPIGFIRYMETFLSRVPSLARWANNLVYACRRTPAQTAP